MTSLRRRLVGATPPVESREQTPDSDDLRMIPAKKLHHLKTKRKGAKRWKLAIFILGGVFGLVVAAFFANTNDLIDLASLADVNLETLLDVLPTNLIREAKEFQVRLLGC
jgi:phospholipid:diacylglycerol acyltransferase